MKLRNSLIVMKFVRGMNIVLIDINTKFNTIIVSCLTDKVSWSSSLATKSTNTGIITELKRIRTNGVRYSGRKFFNRLLLSTPF